MSIKRNRWAFLATLCLILFAMTVGPTAHANSRQEPSASDASITTATPTTTTTKEDIAYERNNVGDNDYSGFNANILRCQSFTPSSDHYVTRVVLKLFRVGLPGAVMITITGTDNAGIPSGADLASGTTDGNTLTTSESGEWRTIAMSSPLHVRASTRYTIIVRSSSTDPTQKGEWRSAVNSTANAPRYSGGTGGWKDNAAAWAMDSGLSYMFEEWGQPYDGPTTPANTSKPTTLTPIHIGGEIGGGYSESTSIRLRVGEMVSGEVTIRKDPMRMSIADQSGNSIQDFGVFGSRGSFYYAAKADGQYYLVMTNPDGFSVGTRGYGIDYVVGPTTLKPGASSGKAVTKDVTKPSISMGTIWLITGIVVFLGLVITMARGRVTARRYYRYEDYGADYEQEGTVGGIQVNVHQRNVPCDNCGGSGKVPSLYIPLANVTCRKCKSTRRLWD